MEASAVLESLSFGIRADVAPVKAVTASPASSAPQARGKQTSRHGSY